MVNRKSLQEFRESGLLWFINSILHTFGWAIVIDLDADIMYPARVKYRGFSEELNDKGYRLVTQYMVSNATELLEETED